MEIPVLLEPLADNSFRASTGAPFALSVEAPSEAEALRSLELSLQSRLAQGGRIVTMTLPTPVHPLAAFAGMFKDDPLFDEVIAIMKERRQAEDAAEEAP